MGKKPTKSPTGAAGGKHTVSPDVTRVISLAGGAYAYVVGVDGLQPRYATDSPAFLDALRDVAATPSGSRVLDDLRQLAATMPNSRWPDLVPDLLDALTATP